jgi:hypothetical protein
MIELLIALIIGMILGYYLKKEQKPPITDILTNQIEYYEKELKYYKDLCKWHAERKYQPVPKQLEEAIDKSLGIERKKK